MRLTAAIPNRIYTLPDLARKLNVARMQGKKIVFTNGVFDILHKGHVASLSEAASYGDFLIVGVNSDASVKRLKGPQRPVNDEEARMLLLATMLQVDAVILFEEDTPAQLINILQPDVLVKGGDYTIDQVAGAKEVLAAGGEVKIAAIVEGISTTAIIEKMRAS